MSFVEAKPGVTRIGWVGTGVMGRWMCQHLINKGYAATVFNRSKDKAQPLLDLGAKVAPTPKAVAEQSDVIFAIVGFPPDVREVFLGASGALAGSKAGSILVDMTTSEPSAGGGNRRRCQGKRNRSAGCSGFRWRCRSKKCRAFDHDWW